MTASWSAIKTFILEAKWMRVLSPLVILILYLVSLSSFLSWLLPEYSVNVNADFVNRAWNFFLLVTAGLYLVFFLLFKIGKGHQITFDFSPGNFKAGDLVLILLPLTPVVQYILNNQDILSPPGSFYVLAVFALFSLVFIVIAPVVLGVFGSRNTLVILGLALTYVITNMASLSAASHWFERGDLIIQLALFAGIFLVGSLLYNLVGRKFMYFVVVVFFVANSANQVFSEKPAETPAETSTISPNVAGKLETLIGARKPLSTPSIYFLIYDAYVTNETMLGYGIDNSAQERYLETFGFELYPRTYSVGGATLATVSRVLNASASYIDSKRKGASGDGVVHNLLKSFGYATYGEFYSDYFFHGTESSYDSAYPLLKATHKLLIKAIFMGEFRFDVEFDNPPREKFVEHKQRMFNKVPSTPRFIYMHDELPGHSQNSGNCRPDETDLFEERLAQANEVMKQDIDLITQQDPGAIVIVAGDHGPYLTKNCNEILDHYDISEISRLDVQDRYGTFLAIKWPTGKFAAYDDITVLQDIFPAIFAYLFEDETILEAKVQSATVGSKDVSGASVVNGIIQGGINDGEPLFIGPN